MNDTLETLNNINSFLDEALVRADTIKHKVKHGKYQIEKKELKDIVLDGHEPRDIERENICKNARKKAHTALADTYKEISDKTREHTTSCSEGLKIINESAETISEMYGLDFMEESVGWGVDFTFFDKPQSTPLSESLDVGVTKTGRKRKCKALGIAEGVFAPITDLTGQRVFSRNKRLYESDHWNYQLENLNFSSKVHSRRMLGMIGHEDKKITDQDLRDGKVSHIVTDLEIREDKEHGKYLWGRLEVINTEAGRNLKEYYEQGIPLFVSSRGGGKLIDVPGAGYKMVDKTRYYCECFDVVREPGFLEAAPIYHSISEEEDNNMKFNESIDYEQFIEDIVESVYLLQQTEDELETKTENKSKDPKKPAKTVDSKKTTPIPRYGRKVDIGSSSKDPDDNNKPKDPKKPAKTDAVKKIKSTYGYGRRLDFGTPDKDPDDNNKPKDPKKPAKTVDSKKTTPIPRYGRKVDIGSSVAEAFLDIINLEEDEQAELITKVSEELGIDESELIEIINDIYNRIEEDNNMKNEFVDSVTVEANSERIEGIAGIKEALLDVLCAEGEEQAELITKVSEELGIDESELVGIVNNIYDRINEGAEMSEAIDISTKTSTKDIIAQLLNPISEKIAQIGDKLSALETTIEEAEVSEAKDCDCKDDENKDKDGEETKKDEEDKKEEKVSEAKDCDCKDGEECPKCKDNDGEEKKDEAKETKKDDEKDEKVSESDSGETVDETWADKDPKETVSERSDLPKPPVGGKAPSDIGSGAWAHEDPKETVTTKTNVADGKNPNKDELSFKAETKAEEKKDAAAVNKGVEGGASVTAHESAEEVSEGNEEPAQNATELTQQITDYKALYDSLKEEFDKCTQVIDELLESIETFGKRHQQVVQESITTKNELNSIKEQLEVANKALNSYKLQEQFNVTVEKANELLSSKNYETVVEELKAAEAQQIEEEAQATADAVSESLSEAIAQPAPVSKRKAHSAFSATISESKDEEISESVETPKKRRAYSAF